MKIIFSILLLLLSCNSYGDLPVVDEPEGNPALGGENLIGLLEEQTTRQLYMDATQSQSGFYTYRNAIVGTAHINNGGSAAPLYFERKAIIKTFKK